VHFAVWAPNASRVSVVGDFNDWDGRVHPMRLHPGIGVWDIFLPAIAEHSLYKFELLDSAGGLLPLKSDPFARYQQPAPGYASVVYRSHYEWADEAWQDRRPHSLERHRPVSIYEVHLGSWRRTAPERRRLSYRELATELLAYVRDLGYTHIELLPVSEYPFDGSWGYQPVGLYAPTSRFGEPDDFKYFVDQCHQAGIGVIVDWVPGHFPRDAHGLYRFDGTALYEHMDPRRGVHSDWDTAVFNYGRREVRNFLLANALFWIREFHIDAFRVDAVASMLYLDYSRGPGEWVPNARGGNENDEAIDFLREVNEQVHAAGAVTIAEESTAWPGVSQPTYAGGLGFSYKWNMGWMHDTLAYVQEDPVHRKYLHERMTFGLLYAFSENFLLPLSHDEVVHGKRSLLGRMPGDHQQRFANLRAYLAFMFAYPGKKLLFMGAELAQHREWDHQSSLDWHLLEYAEHAGVHRLVRDLNLLYRGLPALHELDCEPPGFRWIECEDRDNSVFAWIRWDRQGGHAVAVTNFTPVARHEYLLGVPLTGLYREVLNTDAWEYGGGGLGNCGQVVAQAGGWRDFQAVLRLTLPPLATVILQPADSVNP
jgi:1,4-alpha-glucan branching enzyme